MSLRNQFDREMESIERDFENGDMTEKEYRDSIREMERDYREAARESAQEAYYAEYERW